MHIPCCILKAENATLNSDINIRYGSSLFAQRGSKFPSHLTICEILKPSPTYFRSPIFLSPKPTLFAWSGQAGCTHNPAEWRIRESSLRKHLGKKHDVQSRKLMLTSDVQMWVRKALIYFRQHPVILLNNTVVNLNKIKKRSNPVDKCFH